MNKKILSLMTAMIEYDTGDVRRIQHFIKVHDLAVTIGTMEGLPEEEMLLLEAAAILHDIGIHKSEEKYQSSAGKYQEKEGPGEAEKLLCQQGSFTNSQINRIKYLIAHHHTYGDIHEIDYQILVEADFLVNLYEDNASMAVVKNVLRNIFRTKSGIKLLQSMYNV